MSARPGDPRPISRTALREGTGWLAITYVCRHWRNVALNAARLWACIFINEDTSLNMLRESLKRSRRSSLSIIIEGPPTQTDTVTFVRYMAAMCSVCVHRISALYIYSFLTSEVNTILAPFTRAAPQLDTLVISADPHPAALRGQLLTRIFNNEMPSLTAIIVSQLMIPWRPYQNLTQILLMNQPAPSFPELTSTLRRCPALDSLGLGLYGTDLKPDPPGSEQDYSLIELPLLTSLLLICHHNIASRLVPLLIYPPSATTVLSMQHPPSFHPYKPPAHNPVARVKEAALHLHEHGDFRCVKFMSTTGPVVQVQWDWSESLDVFADGVRLRHISDLVHFSGVTRLTVEHIAFRLSEPDWLHVLRQTPAVAHIHYTACLEDVAPFFSALSALVDDVAGTPALAVCPSLASFVLSGEHTLTLRAMESMVECFEARRRHGSRLNVLEIPIPHDAEPEWDLLIDRMRREDLAETVTTNRCASEIPCVLPLFDPEET